MICPEPTDNYLPTCYQAAVINKKRCLEGKGNLKNTVSNWLRIQKNASMNSRSTGIRALFGSNDPDG
ncbi:MAG: hypothetical protein Ct9H90mP13_09820 [Pseudomonadota bacterium]|nr:MAG: hypothetical protein Ct9H90mP13_09820 [Pseudomonadota bacterium]